MNYAALPQRLFRTEEESELSKILDKIKERTMIIVGAMFAGFGLFVTTPVLLVKWATGFNLMHAIFPQYVIMCSLCACCSIMGALSAVAVALGVGLGVGLNCAETRYIPLRNITNFTANNSQF